MSSANERRQRDREVVEPQDSLGFLEHESFGTAVKVIDRSSGGFTVAIAADKAVLFPGGENATLTIGSQHYSVMISGYYREGNRKSHLGLKRVTSTEPPKRNTYRLPTKNANSRQTCQRERFTYGIFIAFLIGLFSLPGFGDWFGTAPWIRSVVQTSLARFQSAEPTTKAAPSPALSSAPSPSPISR